MKIYISVDLEGISGIVHKSSLGPGSNDYITAQKAMTEDVNAAIEGAIETGAKEIVVNDSHGSMRNLILEDIHKEAKVILGNSKKLGMMEGIDSSYDGVIFIGYHAKASSRGVLAHTINGYTFSRILMNGNEAGETHINAAIAGYYGVPVIMVSGDDFLKKEAESLSPEIEYAQVKELCGQMSAKCLHPCKARELIKDKVKTALVNLKKYKPYKVDMPINLEVFLTNPMIADIVEQIPKMDRIAGNSVRYLADNPLEVWSVLSTISNASMVLLVE